MTGTETKEDPRDKKMKTENVYGAYTWMTYAEVAAKVDAIGSAIVHFGLAVPNDIGVSHARPPIGDTLAGCNRQA